VISDYSIFLCAKVLKGKYYPQGDFLSARKKKHASHTWRAILARWKALNLGLIKRIGDGTQTNVWTDNWIPEGIGFKPIYQKETATADRVSELINHVNMTWDQEALETNFIEADVQAVKRVPLGRSAADVWAWSGEKHGLYTVKLAYRVLADLETLQRQFKEGVRALLNNPIWKRLWRMKVPPKVRVFWWRVIHNFLPTQANLHYRHMERFATCTFCGSKPETIFHALVECEPAIQFWHRLKEMFQVKLPTLHLANWASDLTDPTLCDEFSAAIILCGMWSLWRTRNDIKHGENTILVWKAIDWALDTATQLLAHTRPTIEKSRRQHIKWRPPPLGIMKVNVDAAFNNNSATGSIGVIMRDEAGISRLLERDF
jgi:hypothetical protein